MVSKTIDVGSIPTSPAIINIIMKRFILFLFLSLSIFAQDSLRKPKTSEIQITASIDGGDLTGIVNKKEYLQLKSDLYKWAPIFQISDWNITIMPVPDYVLYTFSDGEPILGLSHWDVDSKTGIIFVMDQKSLKTAKKDFKKYHTFHSLQKEQESIVVHEILHNLVENATEEWAVQILENLIMYHKLPPELLQ